MYFCISVFVTHPHAANNLKSLNHEINYKKKNGPRNTHQKKIRTHEYPRENFEPTKYPLEKFQTHKGAVVQWH